jgi:3-dehydroquinate synthase
MINHRIERTSGVITLGGGVVGDMGGYAAASYMRGIPFIQVPTTLLAQVDAAVGGKVGIDHKKGKNLIGAFYQPKAVIIDTLTLKTLPERQIRAGLAEIIKHGVIRDRELFDYVAKSLDNIFAVDQDTFQKLIPWNCQIKANVVEQDEREGGLRAILNFGHTIGHAIEAVAGYDVYLHGEAIAIGMLAEAQLGAKLGITPQDAVEEIHEIFNRANYPLAKPNISSEDLINSMYMDKKVSKGTLRFALPTKIGDTIIHPLHDQAPIREVWDAYAG